MTDTRTVRDGYEFIGRFEMEADELLGLCDEYAYLCLNLKEWIERIGRSDIPMREVVCLEKDEYFYRPENEKPRLIFGFMIYRQIRTQKQWRKKLSEMVSQIFWRKANPESITAPH